MKMVTLLFFLSMITAGCGLGPDMTKDRMPPEPTPTPFVADKLSVEYIMLGDAAFAGGDHGGAIPHYKRAYEIEKDKQKLEKKQFYDLITKLAISYARAGDTKNARVTAAYGLSKKYDHALFHYSLACSYAVEGDESNALYHLGNAYRFQGKLGPGETLPDPLSDEPFSGISESTTSKDAVARMKK